MKQSEHNISNRWLGVGESARQPGRSTPSHALHLVSTHELQDLSYALGRGVVPRDFEAKLARLAGEDLRHHYIVQHSRLFMSVLLAAQAGAFAGGSATDRERLLRVLAYVRKDDDAIPDYRPDGFADDLEEVRAAHLALAPLLQEFKHWRLEHQVPRIWLNQFAHAVRPELETAVFGRQAELAKVPLWSENKGW